MYFQIVLLCFCAGFLQGKPIENTAEIKPATPIEPRTNEIKAPAPLETRNNEIKAPAPLETRNNEIKAQAQAPSETRNNGFKAPETIGPIDASRTELFKSTPIRSDIMGEIKTAMEFLSTKIRDYSDRISNKEEFNGIIEARNRLETAIKPLDGVFASDAASTNLEAVMSSSVRTAQSALDNLTIKQVRQMERIAEDGKTKTVEEQERALNEFAEKQDDNVKKAIHRVFEAKENADNALEKYMRSHNEALSQDARKANDQILIVMQDKKLTIAEKQNKLEEFVNTLSDSVRGELDLRDMREIKQLVNNYTGVAHLVHTGSAGGL